MQPLTQKQIKIGWIVAAILVLVHFLPGMVNTAMQAIALHRRSIAAAHAVSVPVAPMAHVKLDAPDVPPTGPAFPPEAQARFLGVWNGSQMGDTNCQIHLELRPSPYQPGYVAGYETRICYDLAKLVAHRTPDQNGMTDALRAKSPVATILTGSLFEGDLTFRVDRSIGASPFVCPIESYSVAPFGSQQIVAMWKSHGDCPDGQMVLTRSKG